MAANSATRSTLRTRRDSGIYSPVVHEGLTFRQATAADSDTLADIVIGDAEQESTRVAMRLYGLRRFETARALFRASWRAGNNWRASTVALRGEQAVGVLQVGGSWLRVTPGLAVAAVVRLGPLLALRFPRRLRVRARVSPRMPPGAYVIAEIHVAPACRG